MFDLSKYEVGELFPGDYPDTEGATMELQADGPVVLIQMRQLLSQEQRAFKSGFTRYSYFESDTPIPAAFWVFDFSPPMGLIDVNFSAQFASRDYLDYFLRSNDGTSNQMLFLLFDGAVLKGAKLVNLSPEAVFLFKETIRKQLTFVYRIDDYEEYLSRFLDFKAIELFNLGKQFVHRE